MPEQIPWEKFSESMHLIAMAQFPIFHRMSLADRKVVGERRTAFLNSIAEAMKAELERAMNHGFSKGCGEGYWSEDGPDFENWYANTYQK